MSSSQLPLGRIAVVIALGATTLLAFKFSSGVNKPTESGVIMNLPTFVQDFTGKPEELSEGEKYVLPKDTEMVKKLYTDPAGDMVNASIVLAGAEKRSIHRPELCLPAQGWSIDREQVIPVKLADGRQISIMQVSISRQVETSPGVMHPLSSYYDYWFVGKGVTTPSHVTRILLNSWDRVVHHRNHRWAYIAVGAPILEGFKEGGKNPEETEKMLTDFIAEMAPSVMKRDDGKADTAKN